MTIAYFNGTVVIRKGATVNLGAILNSSSPSAGGDYDGPMALLGIPDAHHQVITTVSAGIEFIQQVSNLTSTCVYHVALRNDGDQDNTCYVDGFYDG